MKGLEYLPTLIGSELTTEILGYCDTAVTVIITIGPCNFFSTLMGFLSASALGKVMGQAAGYGSTNFEPGSCRQPSDSQIEPNIP